MIRGFLFTFISVVFLSGCLPQEAPRVPVTDELNSTNDQNTGFETPDSNANDATQEDAYFYSAGNKLQTLTIDYNNTDVHYIFGGDVDQYLKSTNGIKDYQVVDGVSTPLYYYTYEETFCAVISFTQTFSQSPNQLRVLAIPASTMNFSTGVRTRYYRLKLNTSEGNSFCNKTIDNKNGTLSTPPAGVVFDTEDVCPSCNNIISSSDLIIYKYNEDTNYLEQVNEVNDDGLTLRLDMNGQSGTGTSTCTDTQCNAEGFDCCINGQCVNEAALILSGVSSDPAGFANAENEKANDANWYLNYPQFYYSCLEEPPQDTGDDPLDPSDPTGDAQARLDALYEDYKCIEQLREFAVEAPYVKDYTDNLLPVSQGNYTECSFTAGDNMHYQTVLKRLYDECGCAEKDDLSIMADSCPAYYYKATFVKDSSGNDTDEVQSIACYTPPVEGGPVPFEDRDVTVNSRTAPHRFFNEDNEEYSLADPLPDGVNSTQEGTTFQYLDDEKLFPLNGSYNMNSILGNMNVNLTEARPAKVINVEYDKVYYLAGISGYYTPCPSCSKDSWFANFTAFPSTLQGHGVRATGFTTSRTEWGTNSSLANYEDLIFGRACWIPPTMLPYSHSAIDGISADAQTQRLNRLKTQAALYINGYQRDWYGFNKGALIGSFDGVTWFAIGKNRIVRATSDKLFLAINAPFADLANPNDQIVHVAEYDFISTGARYDYKDTSEINDVDQNDGGLCQRYHQCDTDTDCITQLGWEYVCANVTQTKTKWPVFEPIGAIEKNDTETIGNIVQFLQQGELPPDTPSLKRCVYRGAGAPCRVDYENISNYNLRKSLSCAPNFFCASLSSNVFNDELARFGNSLDAILEPKNHLVGRDANVLGRPKDYIGANHSLEPGIISTLKENLLESDSGINNQEGLCVPGKSLPDYISTSFSTNTNQIEQQKEKDPNGRTDYISQISGCNSSLHTIMRYSSCPMIDTDGNYLHNKDSYINDSVEINFGIISAAVSSERATQFYSLQQNACGLENIDEAVTIGQGVDEELLRAGSAFKLIHGRDLSSSDTQIEPILAQNACFRRAGAVCHTDLDCSPGKKHFEILDVINPDFFGNTPERKYWEEYLVCGQMDKEPFYNADDQNSIDAYNEWNMSNNRCCREVGKEITMYTEDTPTQMEETGDLRTDIYGGVNANDPRRYSRYMNASPLMREDPYSTFGAFVAEFLGRPSANTENTFGELDNATNITNPNQWITFAETGGRTCCGGSWIRKFADGTNDWSVKRLSLDVTDFKCLNYKSPLILTDNPEVYDLKDSQLNLGLANFCFDTSGENGNCVQHQFELEYQGEFDKQDVPRLDDTVTTMWINSDYAYASIDDEAQDDFDENPFTFGLFMNADAYNPLNNGNSANNDSLFMDWGSDWEANYEDGESRKYLAVIIPSFVTFRNDNYDSSTLFEPFPQFFQQPLSTPKAPLTLRVELEDPRNDVDEEYLQCRRIVPTSYNCADTGAWGGLCDYTLVQNIGTWASNCSSSDPCCYMYNQQSRELRITYPAEVICELDQNSTYSSCDGTNKDDYGDWLYYGASDPLSLRIEFTAAGTLRWEQEKMNHLGATTLDDATLVGGSVTDSMFYHRRSSEPGHALYYLNKLSRFELLGIPQIAYEPVFCNDNYQKMVPNLFISELDNTQNGGDGNGILTSYDWMNSDLTFRDPGAVGNWGVGSAAFGDPLYDPGEFYGDNEFRAGTFEVVNHPKIFSEHEFKCCKPLGSEVLEGEDSLCCSGYAVATEGDGGSGQTTTDDTEKFVCKLPVGTDLYVYLNRFVSGEGADLFDPGDFDDRTGELKVSSEIQAKVTQFGQEHCDGGDGNAAIIPGGAFGEYDPEPFPTILVTGGGNKVMSIVDSQFDIGDGGNPSGFDQFERGFRWNHHLYCGSSQ